MQVTFSPRITLLHSTVTDVGVDVVGGTVVVVVVVVTTVVVVVGAAAVGVADVGTADDPPPQFGKARSRRVAVHRVSFPILKGTDTGISAYLPEIGPVNVAHADAAVIPFGVQ